MGERGRLARRRRPGSPDVTQTPLDCGIMLDVYDGGLTRDQELQGPLAPTASPGLGAHRGLAGAGGSSGARPSAPPGGPGARQQAPLAPRVSRTLSARWATFAGVAGSDRRRGAPSGVGRFVDNPTPCPRSVRARRGPGSSGLGGSHPRRGGHHAHVRCPHAWLRAITPWLTPATS